MHLVVILHLVKYRGGLFAAFYPAISEQALRNRNDIVELLVMQFDCERTVEESYFGSLWIGWKSALKKNNGLVHSHKKEIFNHDYFEMDTLGRIQLQRK